MHRMIKEKAQDDKRENAELEKMCFTWYELFTDTFAFA
jgi:hypothetical protein